MSTVSILSLVWRESAEVRALEIIFGSIKYFVVCLLLNMHGWFFEDWQFWAFYLPMMLASIIECEFGILAKARADRHRNANP